MTLINRQSKVAPHITLEGHDEASLQKADNALGKIQSGRNGGALLDHLKTLDNGGKHVKIRVAGPDSESGNSTTPVHDINQDPSGANNKKGAADAKKMMFGLKGKGASSVVAWNPNTSLKLNHDGKPTGIDKYNGDQAYLSLGHELVHSYRIGKGTYTGGAAPGEGYVPGSKHAAEEDRAVGLAS